MQPKFTLSHGSHNPFALSIYPVLHFPSSHLNVIFFFSEKIINVPSKPQYLISFLIKEKYKFSIYSNL